MNLRAPIAAALLSLALAGCSTSEGEVDNDPPVGSNSDEQVPEVSEEPEETEEETEAAAPEFPSFGDSYSWDTGLSVTISKPVEYEPGQYSAGGEGPGVALRFTVTVVNGTQDVYEPVGDYITLQSGNAEAEQIFDSENNINGSPNTKLLPGREAKYEVAFKVKNPKDLVMEFQPNDYELESVLYITQ